MPRKPKSSPPDAPAPAPAEILDQFIGQGPIAHEEAQGRGPPVQESHHRARLGRRAHAPPRLSARRDNAAGGDASSECDERRFTGFDDTSLALYARGMPVREIQGRAAVTTS